MDLKKRLPLIGGGVVVVLLLVWFVSVSNSLVSAKQNVDGQWSQVEINMQRRYDVTNEMVGLLKGQMHHEDKLIKMVTDARKQYANAKTPTEKMKADTQLSKDTNVIINVVHEKYPQLEAGKNFQTMMMEFEGTENRMSFSRREYNDMVKSYNNLILRFPTSIVAQMKGYHQMSYFHADEAAQKAPKVDFGDN